MAGRFVSLVGGDRLLLRIICFAIGTIAIICLNFTNDYVGIGLTMAAVGWSLVHILFLEIKKELHPALSIIFDFTSTVITISYAIVGLTATMGVDNPLCMTTTVIRMILGLTKLAKFKSIELDDSHMGSLEIGSEALMGLTGITHFLFFVIACRDVQNRRRRPWDLTEK